MLPEFLVSVYRVGNYMGVDTKPVYVLSGKDTRLRDEARKRIVSQIIGDSDPQLCLGTFDSTAELADVLDELRTLPFLAPHRVVIVRNADAFISANRDALEKYLDAPAPSGTLILLVDSLNSRTKLAKKIPTIGQVIDCSTPTGAKLVGWIRDYVIKAGKKIDGNTTNLLVQFSGEDLATLTHELDKLLAYTADRPAITPTDLTKIVSATHAPEAFELSNAITRGDLKAALTVLASVLSKRGAEFMLLGELAWHIRRSLQVQQRIEAGDNPQFAMKAANVFYGQREFMDMLKRRPQTKLQKDMRRLIAADLGMKSGLGAKPAMQQLVTELCN